MMRERIIFDRAVVDFQTDQGPLRVVGDVSFTIHGPFDFPIQNSSAIPWVFEQLFT